LLAAEGPASAYNGTIGRSLLALSEERGGLVTADDLGSYEPVWSEPVEVVYLGRRVLTRRGLSSVPETLARLPRLRGLSPVERALALARVLAGPAADGDTTNLVAVDGDGSACVLTSSLGLGSGDFLPGLDLHLNSMLGEADLLHGPLVPGDRMASMMAPTLVLDGAGLELAAGAAGGTRLRSALLQSIAGVLDEELPPQEAVSRPRLHPAGNLVHLEPGLEPGVEGALVRAGYETRSWASLHHYFGGVSLLARSGGAGDPRRNGSVRPVE
jgi:gamma-glutamyltranspeptidase/glutathione hydrolase